MNPQASVFVIPFVSFVVCISFFFQQLNILVVQIYCCLPSQAHFIVNRALTFYSAVENELGRLGWRDAEFKELSLLRYKEAPM